MIVLGGKKMAARKGMDRTIDGIYAACDEEFGAEHHYAAVRRADQFVENFEADRPRNAVQGYRLMRQAYAEVAAQHKPKEEPRPLRPRPASWACTRSRTRTSSSPARWSRSARTWRPG